MNRLSWLLCIAFVSLAFTVSANVPVYKNTDFNFYRLKSVRLYYILNQQVLTDKNDGFVPYHKPELVLLQCMKDKSFQKRITVYLSDKIDFQADLIVKIYSVGILDNKSYADIEFILKDSYSKETVYSHRFVYQNIISVEELLQLIYAQFINDITD